MDIFNQETMQKSIEFMNNCSNHPRCEGCEYNNGTNVNGIVCENAVERKKNVQ